MEGWTSRITKEPPNAAYVLLVIQSRVGEIPDTNLHFYAVTQNVELCRPRAHGWLSPPKAGQP